MRRVCPRPRQGAGRRSSCDGGAAFADRRNSIHRDEQIDDPEHTGELELHGERHVRSNRRQRDAGRAPRAPSHPTISAASVRRAVARRARASCASHSAPSRPRFAVQAQSGHSLAKMKSRGQDDHCRPALAWGAVGWRIVRACDAAPRPLKTALHLGCDGAQVIFLITLPAVFSARGARRAVSILPCVLDRRSARSRCMELRRSAKRCPAVT